MKQILKILYLEVDIQVNLVKQVRNTGNLSHSALFEMPGHVLAQHIIIYTHTLRFDI